MKPKGKYKIFLDQPVPLATLPQAGDLVKKHLAVKTAEAANKEGLNFKAS